MQNLNQSQLIDLHLAHRILELVIETTTAQIGKKQLDLTDPAEAIHEIWISKGLKPPFDELYSYSRLVQEVLKPLTLLDYANSSDWTVNTVEITIQLLKSHRLIQEIQLDESQYIEPVKVFVLPLGLLIYNKISKITNAKPTDKQTILLQSFSNWIDECHFDHSRYTLDALIKKVDKSIRRGQSLSDFNISLALLLLMYGAIRKDRALKIRVDPKNNITELSEVISNELIRISKQVIGRNPLAKSTLLDKIQESNKIKNTLDDSNLYQRDDETFSDGGKKYHLYFNLGQEINDGETLARLERVLRAIIIIAKKRERKAPEKIIALFREHITDMNFVMKPVDTKSLFGVSPSIQYLRTLHSQAERIVYGEEELENQDQEDDEDS